jgi:hypothetical protein
MGDEFGNAMNTMAGTMAGGGLKLAASIFVPGPEVVAFKLFAKTKGYQLLKSAGKWVLRKLERNGSGQALKKVAEDEAKVLYQEYDATKVAKGKYREAGGHHVHGKAGFKGSLGYDPKEGFSISQEYMKSRKWNHQDMTNKQRELFAELAKSGRPNTLVEHSSIAKEALIAGGATPAEAEALVRESLANLAKQGVTFPTGIPWRK